MKCRLQPSQSLKRPEHTSTTINQGTVDLCRFSIFEQPSKRPLPGLDFCRFAEASMKVSAAKWSESSTSTQFGRGPDRAKDISKFGRAIGKKTCTGMCVWRFPEIEVPQKEMDSNVQFYRILPL